MNPIEKLMAEHQVILKGLDILERGAARLENGEDISADFFIKAVDFIRNYADKYHHAKEENILFTQMEKAGFSPNMGPVAMMLYEHNQGREYVAEIEAAAGLYANGDRSGRDKIAAYCHDFANLLRQHIHKEDMVLYPMVKNVLGEQGIESMIPDFEAVEKKQEGIEQRYLQLLDYLAS